MVMSPYLSPDVKIKEIGTNDMDEIIEFKKGLKIHRISPILGICLFIGFMIWFDAYAILGSWNVVNEKFCLFSYFIIPGTGLTGLYIYLCDLKFIKKYGLYRCPYYYSKHSVPVKRSKEEKFLFEMGKTINDLPINVTCPICKNEYRVVRNGNGIRTYMIE